LSLESQRVRTNEPRQSLGLFVATIELAEAQTILRFLQLASRRDDPLTCYELLWDNVRIFCSLVLTRTMLHQENFLNKSF